MGFVVRLNEQSRARGLTNPDEPLLSQNFRSPRQISTTVADTSVAERRMWRSARTRDHLPVDSGLSADRTTLDTQPLVRQCYSKASRRRVSRPWPSITVLLIAYVSGCKRPFWLFEKRGMIRRGAGHTYNSTVYARLVTFAALEARHNQCQLQEDTMRAYAKLTVSFVLHVCRGRVIAAVDPNRRRTTASAPRTGTRGADTNRSSRRTAKMTARRRARFRSMLRVPPGFRVSWVPRARLALMTRGDKGNYHEARAYRRVY